MDKDEAVLVFLAFVLFSVLVHLSWEWWESRGCASDDELFDAAVQEAKLLAAVLPDKNFSDLPVHMSNHKRWVTNYIKVRVGVYTCNQSR